MTIPGRGRTPWRRAAVAAVAAVMLVALGAIGTYVYMRRSMAPMDRTPARSEAPTPAGAVKTAGEGPLPDVTITLTPEAVQRAGITVTSLGHAAATGSLRLPGVVEPNAYRQVTVTPLVAGRITSVSAALGDRVSRGQTLAQIYSPELPDAQTRYLTMSAELEAAHQRLLRTERLVEIGAASRQELETIRAEHTSHATAVEGARARLILLGLDAERISQLRTAADVTATVSVQAPLAGTITERSANVGLNVDPSTALFKVVDLSTVWVAADLYERDFARVTVGTVVTVTTAAYPGLALPAKVSYIDPQVNPDTRTAKLRIEVVNRSQPLRLGLYVEVSVSGAASSGVLVVPRTALQTVGDRQVVYLADPKQPGKFVEREVRIGNAFGKDVEVTSGVMSGDLVVTEGSFALRAERERLGLRVGSVAG
jgi:membrane fusion protein, heavy metal efflux system